ncbi:MAG TPA: hypothetical protein VFW96_18390 [Thermomicrobiales bacterium]|nr:hypothetical protein [Thermomicrobiales bacterium]
MSTTAEVRGGALLGARRAGGATPAAGAGARREAGRPRERPVRTAAARALPGRKVAALRPALVVARPRGAVLFGVAALALSALGLLYLVQISRVASYGYQLTRLQDEQAKLDGDYQLLVYAVSGERTTARVDDTARREYGMRPLAGSEYVDPQDPTSRPPEAPARFITVDRPVAAPPAPPPAPPQRPSLAERLWQRLAGVGVSRGP